MILKLNNKKLKKELSDNKGISLLQIIIVLAIIGFLLIIVMQGVTKIRQIILTSNAAKEVATYLKEARRRSINNVVTSNNAPTYGYYIELDDPNDRYLWGECDNVTPGECSASDIKSNQYSRVQVSNCGSYDTIKFKRVTGEFVINTGNPSSDVESNVTCTITLQIQGSLMTTRKQIEVNAEDRTIKIL